MALDQFFKATLTRWNLTCNRIIGLVTMRFFPHASETTSWYPSSLGQKASKRNPLYLFIVAQLSFVYFWAQVQKILISQYTMGCWRHQDVNTPPHHAELHQVDPTCTDSSARHTAGTSQRAAGLPQAVTGAGSSRPLHACVPHARDRVGPLANLLLPLSHYICSRRIQIFSQNKCNLSGYIGSSAQ
jgi:hypothetical protein